MTENIGNDGSKPPARIDLSLEGHAGNGTGGGRSAQAAGDRPIAGYVAIALGLLGIFAQGFIFVPLAFIASLIALISGQVVWGIGGLVLSFVGLVTSPVLLTFLGLSAIVTALGIL